MARRTSRCGVASKAVTTASTSGGWLDTCLIGGWNGSLGNLEPRPMEVAHDVFALLGDWLWVEYVEKHRLLELRWGWVDRLYMVVGDTWQLTSPESRRFCDMARTSSVFQIVKMVPPRTYDLVMFSWMNTWLVACPNCAYLSPSIKAYWMHTCFNPIIGEVTKPIAFNVTTDA